MNPRVRYAKPESNYFVHVWFENGEGTIQWANEADLCPDTVYLDSVKC